MIVTYHGAEMIKITSGDLTIAINPISKVSKLKTVKFGADIALVSRKLPEFNGIAEVTRKDKTPFVIDGPGEYEVMNVFVKGLKSKSEYKTSGINTIYSLKIDDINVVFLGALSEAKPDMSFIEDMDTVDLVFVPIGGDGVLDFSEGYKLAVSLEPKVIIPVHYGGGSQKDTLKNFIKESGSSVESLDKFVFKKKDLENKSAELVVLKTK